MKSFSKLVLSLALALSIGVPVWGSYVIPNGSVTKRKLAALGQQVSSSSGAFTTSSTTYVDVTNLSVSITSTGRPVVAQMISDGNTSNNALFGISSVSASGEAACAVKLLRGSTVVGLQRVGTVYASSQVANEAPSSSLIFVDTPSAGTYTYKIQMEISSSVTSGVTCFLQYSELLVYEL